MVWRKKQYVRRYWKKEPQSKQPKTTELGDIRKANVRRFFTAFTKDFLPWLHELARQYKLRGDYPVMACWLLPSYYTDAQDVEVAAIASMLIKDDDRLLEHVAAFRDMFCQSPSEWFRSRAFVALSMGDQSTKVTGGVLNRRIAEYFSCIYDRWTERQRAMSVVMAWTFGAIRYQERLDMLRLVLATSDGFGRGLWSIIPTDLRCPLTADVKALIATFFPNYRMFEDNEIVSMFQFDVDYDLFYAALAYKELQRKRPDECRRLATVYQKRYKDANLLRWEYWTGKKGILPEIKFE